MAKRVSRSLIVASASAITAVYLAGFVMTQSAADQITAAEARGGIATPTRQAASATPTPPAGNVRVLPTAGRPAVTTIPPTPSPAPSIVQAPAVTYHDGVYAGLGVSRRGDVEVTITIQDGRIASAVISHSTTQYPISRIASLPGQVVARQGAQVDIVSGATLSARAFQDATRQALTQAQHAVQAIGIDGTAGQHA